MWVANIDAGGKNRQGGELRRDPDVSILKKEKNSVISKYEAC